ncbi:MAG: hypothetical protein KDK56_00355 [Simkania sp.]|nr:hypothetical protein [Simkania sp.]MCP5491290.1 hypothetical protein [Chlamydiales bacterium]
MKKILLTLLLFAAISAHAETEMRMRNLENRVNSLEQKKESGGHYDPITPNAGPKVYDGMDMFITLDFIFWTARLDSLSYSQTGIGSLTELENPSKGNVNSVDWTWDPGFKVGYGWTFCHGGWDLFLQYTWFYTNVGDARHSHHLKPAFKIVPPSGQEINMERAHAHWDLHYQVGDLELGRNYYINRFLKLRPFVGVKGTWQKQDYNVFFEAIPFQLNQNITIFNYKMRQDHMLWGLGMRTGLNTSWQFISWFSLYGDIALTGLWTHYNLDRKDTFSEVIDIRGIDVGLDRTSANLQDTLHCVKPVLEFAIGLRIETYFNCNRLHARLQAGWEAQIWPSQTIYINVLDQSNRYDLSLQGLTVKFRLDF